MRDRLLRYSACECYHSRSTNQETGAGMLLTFFNISNLIPPPLTKDKAKQKIGWKDYIILVSLVINSKVFQYLLSALSHIHLIPFTDSFYVDWIDKRQWYLWIKHMMSDLLKTCIPEGCPFLGSNTHITVNRPGPDTRHPAWLSESRCAMLLLCVIAAEVARRGPDTN